jgi:hypothetical protein
MNEWINVKDSLPEKDCILKVKRENLNECKAYFWKDQMMWLLRYFKYTPTYFQNEETNEFIYDVTHWMPLTNPPEG